MTLEARLKTLEKAQPNAAATSTTMGKHDPMMELRQLMAAALGRDWPERLLELTTTDDDREHCGCSFSTVAQWLGLRPRTWSRDPAAEAAHWLDVVVVGRPWTGYGALWKGYHPYPQGCPFHGVQLGPILRRMRGIPEPAQDDDQAGGPHGHR